MSTQTRIAEEAHRPLMSPRPDGCAIATDLASHPDPFLLDLRVTPDQISATIDHVSNVFYVAWLDRAAELHADSLGLTRRALLDHNQMWFVARHEIDYLAESWLDDELVIATWVRSIRKVKSWRDYVIVRPSDQQVICRASTLWVLVDLSTRRPIRLSSAMIGALNPLESHV